MHNENGKPSTRSRHGRADNADHSHSIKIDKEMVLIRGWSRLLNSRGANAPRHPLIPFLTWIQDTTVRSGLRAIECVPAFLHISIDLGDKPQMDNYSRLFSTDCDQSAIGNCGHVHLLSQTNLSDINVPIILIMYY